MTPTDLSRFLSITTPTEIAILPLMSTVPFPREVVPIHVGHPANIQLIREHSQAESHIVLVYTEVLESWESREPHRRIGVSASILSQNRLPNGGIQVHFQTRQRVHIKELIGANPYHKGFVIPISEPIPEHNTAVTSLVEACIGAAKNYPQEPRYNPALFASLAQQNPGNIADILATNLSCKAQEKQKILEAIDVQTRLARLCELLQQERDSSRISQDINRKVKDGLKHSQREFYLRQQLKAIREELGDEDALVRDLRSRATKQLLPDMVRRVVDHLLERLRQLSHQHSEHAVLSAYLDVVLSIPWGVYCREQLDLTQCEQLLAERHYGLSSLKERILEFLAVRSLNPTRRGPILCFAGPPGTGKTSFASSVATALGRPLVKLSLGGVRDEAEIRGHRRTYVGALPGKIVQALRRSGCMNPVILLDELDKLGRNQHGDPTAALLEVLDPEQHQNFVDHYLDLPLDLSQVIFVGTANHPQDIPAPLLDRLELLSLSGYSLQEKKEIARQYLIPSLLESHRLDKQELQFSEAALQTLVQEYTREAGTRELARTLEKLCRKRCRQKLAQHLIETTIDREELYSLLGSPRYPAKRQPKQSSIGCSLGLAWSQSGGEILPIEAQLFYGTGQLVLTGRLGEVFRESAQTAIGYLRARAEREGKELFAQTDLHLHLPSNSIFKDGPSAGLAIALAVASLVWQQALPSQLCMTGEVTLHGHVLAVGGLREKLLAAQRAGCTRVIVPLENQRDVSEFADESLSSLKIVFVEHIEEALEEVWRDDDETPSL